VRRAVARRDKEQCTYVDCEGRRCPSRSFLQLHHEHAHALGGASTFENLRLLCGAHNRLLAEQDFGRAHQMRCIARQGISQAEPAQLLALATE
jgi:5-methylcytosine-specific restriction endonuclease McrA